MKKILIISLLFFHQAWSKTIVRVAFDIGSSSTKMLVVRVDTSTQKIKEVLLNESVKVDYAQSVAKSNMISQDLVTQGIAALAKLKQRAIELQASEFSAVATAVFRNTKNGQAVINQLNKALNLNIQIISQETEARLGFYSGLSVSDCEAKDTLVWDIGGSSMQMAYYLNGQFLTYAGRLASKSLRNFISTKVQIKEVEKSPNPISSSEAYLASKKVKQYLSETISFELRSKLNDPNTCVVGIGGVLSKSVPSHLFEMQKTSVNNRTFYQNLNVYNQLDVFYAFWKKLGLTDDDLRKLGSEYPDTEISNLILVLSSMEFLKINELQFADVNLTHGLVIHPDYWPK